MDKHVAPPLTYWVAMLIGLNFFFKIPFEGLALFISAITEILLFLRLLAMVDLKKDLLFWFKEKITFFLSKIIFFFFIIDDLI